MPCAASAARLAARGNVHPMKPTTLSAPPSPLPALIALLGAFNLACGAIDPGGFLPADSSSSSAAEASAGDSGEVGGSSLDPDPNATSCEPGGEGSGDVVMFDDAGLYVLSTANANVCQGNELTYTAWAWEVCGEIDCAPYRFNYIGETFSCADGVPAQTTVAVHRAGWYVFGWEILSAQPINEGLGYTDSWQCFLQSQNSELMDIELTEDDYNDVTEFVLEWTDGAQGRHCVSQCTGDDQHGSMGCASP